MTPWLKRNGLGLLLAAVAAGCAGVVAVRLHAGQVLHALPLLLAVLCVLAIAYRYYSAFLARKVARLDDSLPTPAHTLRDGQNYDPTGRWVLFGHHFAAISGAGPLIGPVLAIQFGYPSVRPRERGRPLSSTPAALRGR